LKLLQKASKAQYSPNWHIGHWLWFCRYIYFHPKKGTCTNWAIVGTFAVIWQSLRVYYLCINYFPDYRPPKVYYSSILQQYLYQYDIFRIQVAAIMSRERLIIIAALVIYAPELITLHTIYS
jgi:hypothetical protein